MNKLFQSACLKQSFDWDNFNESVEKIVDELGGEYLKFHDNGNFSFVIPNADNLNSPNEVVVQNTFKDNGFDYWWKINKTIDYRYSLGNGDAYLFNHEDGSPNPDEYDFEY